MSAISTFSTTIARARAFLTLHGSLTPGQNAAMPASDDLLRSGLVFSVAAMDAYFTDRFSESVVRYIKKHGATTGLVEFLSKAGLDTKAALEMLTMDRPYRKIRTLVEDRLSNYTTQKQNVIDELFLIYAVKSLSANAQKKAKRKTLLTSVRSAVVRRHYIVHAGDLNAHDKIRSLTHQVASRYISNIELYVNSAEQILVKALKI